MHQLRAACLFLAALAGLTATACSRPGEGAAGGQADRVSPNAGYTAPPTPALATRLANGNVRLSGTAPAGAQVRLAGPDGTALQAVAGADGTWGLILPPASEVRMFAVSAKAGADVLRAEGALIVLPAPATPAVLARAGFGAAALAPSGGAPQLVALDYDSSGGAAVAGLAAKGAEVRLSLDGDDAGIDQADDLGRFAIVAPNQRLSAGRHTVAVEASGGVVRVDTVYSAPQPLASPFRAVRQSGAWRVDWSLPGGGVQTTVVFDPPAQGRP
jgi:hypothetical protein